MNYYLITDFNRDGEHEYYDRVPIKSSKPKEQWHENWENLYLCWQYGAGWIDEKNGDFWSDDRIVSVYEVRDMTEEEYNVFTKFTSEFDIDEIITEGKENWDEAELQPAWDKYNEKCQ
jgi:hypothetical protein